MIRRLLCWLGIHYYQYLLAPPTWKRGDKYDPGVWCIFCNRRGPRGPGDGALVPRTPRNRAPDTSRVPVGVACG